MSVGVVSKVAGMSCAVLYHLPPEILEQIFAHFTADLAQLRAIANTCCKFRAVVSQVIEGKK